MFGSSAPDFAVQDAALYCAGMPQIWYAAALWRVLGDKASYLTLYARLHKLASHHTSKAVSRRAHLLATLVLTEDKSTVMESVGVIPPLLACHRSQYYRDLRQPHLDLRARLDSWNRGAVSWIVRRCR